MPMAGGDLSLPVPGTIARWYELQWISQVFLEPHSHHLHPGSYLPLKGKGGNLIFCLDDIRYQTGYQTEMTSSPQASVNSPTAFGLKAISQELYGCIRTGDSMGQNQLGNKKVSEATALPTTKSHLDALSPTKAVSSRCWLLATGGANERRSLLVRWDRDEPSCPQQ